MQGLRLSDRENQFRQFGLTLCSAKADDEALSRVAIFRSMESALAFAYTQRAILGVKVGEIKEYTGKEGGTLVLTTHEKKAQARFILDVIESHLSLDQIALLDATYGGENGERHAGIERLMHRFDGQNRKLVNMLLMREFVHGERFCPGQADIARECGVHRSTACRIASKIAQEIAELRKSTIEKLRPAFARRRWIPREDDK